MADNWYYVRDGQQTGPVSASQLQQLARSGQLQGADLVWREGLPQWIQARSVTGLIAAEETAAPIPFAPDDRPPYRDNDPDDRPRRRPRERDDDDYDDRSRRRVRRERYEDDDEDDYRPRRRRRRRAASGWEGLPTGAKAGILVGALVLVLLAVLVPVLIYTNGFGPDDGDRTFSGRLTFNDPPDRSRGAIGCRAHIYHYRMKAGTTYTIRMSTNALPFDPFLRLEDPNGNEVAFDDDSDGYPNARIIFTARQDGSHRIIATSFDQNVGPYQITVTRQPPPRARR
jgi:hypothetical protein